VDSSFSSVFAFLRNFEGGEVEGHSSNPPSEVEIVLNKLLSGKLSAEEKRETCDLLRNEPEWVGWMADRVKARRTEAVSR
jgi:hypothetical protein